ncbi:peptide-N4-(N-acetyl-beta-glucosaminyl)asparagine amidase A-like [Aristolochia californica]|uniref:peptide-N4-(N-acetyl-beta- glucosaminyl)asparagine amidase A-like n=1 Tax=Aristolochia californica TaxID=171875 RepID=UPI0035DD9461
MAFPTFSLPLLLLLLQLVNPLLSLSNLHKAKLLEPETLLESSNADDVPTRFFQVTRPIKLPTTKPCSYPILQHDFGFTYGKPPVTAPYTPPTSCPSQNFSKIVMEWTATCKGRQFDRIFGVWLGGVELLRSCTAEPKATGIVWTVEKDITRYSSLLKTPQTLAVHLANLVDKTYTGIYHVNITLHFYPAEEEHPNSAAYLGNNFDSHPDLIIPISRNLPLNDGLWFIVENSTDTQFKEFVVPRNTYRAVLEVFVSFHSSDEFWYTNPPDEYIKANNLTGVPGNGSFREVVVSLDGKTVGAVWPFTVVYTGGINPLLWRPITGIGSFDLPVYNIEITPFLGNILDGKLHEFGFGVTNALNVWFIDANLHLWLDHKSSITEGHLVRSSAEPFSPSIISHFSGLNGTFVTVARRNISATGWVKSSHGKITTHSFQNFDFLNRMLFGKDGDEQIVNQTIFANYGVYAEFPAFNMYSTQVSHHFPLYLYTDTLDEGNGSYSLVSNVSMGFNEEKFSSAGFGFSYSSLRNKQKGQGSMLVKGNLVVGGLSSTQQAYKYFSNGGCYFRTVRSKNYTVLSDESGETCGKEFHGFGYSKRPPFGHRRASLAAHFGPNPRGNRLI